jgi:nudix-type nucleoside diphosphatase (YffH/AdpP family)
VADWPRTNPDVRITDVEVLSDNWYVLRKATFDYRSRDGTWSRQQREAYDRGDGVTILMVDWDRRTVLLTRQFRLPAYLNGHRDGMLIEAPAGLLDGDEPQAAICREAEEETGYRVSDPVAIFQPFMSPGSVTERVVFFVATYSHDDRVHDGGGLAHEGEDIHLVEMPLDEAYAAVREGAIEDGKTIMLLQWAELHELRR